MIHLHYANRLENLIEPLAGVIAEQQRADPLERVTIVVPNRVQEQFVKHRVAEAIGIAANLDLPFLRNFLGDSVRAANPTLRILDLEELELVLFQSLRTALRSQSREFDAPRRYVETAQATPEEREFRTVRLARQMAWLFREYSIARRPMLHRWFTNTSSGETDSSPTEQWQKHLWISTFDGNGYLRPEWTENAESKWILLPYAFDKLSKSELSSTLPPTLHVFGLAYAGQGYLKIFAQIAELIDLHIYTMNPCREFWEDVVQPSRFARASWARRAAKLGANLEQPGDPFNLDAGDDTPALRLWARPGREYIRTLNELTDCVFDAHFTDDDHSPASLLGELQQDILNRAPERKAGEHTLLDNDGSIRFLACPGMAREVEIVANEIWSLLERDPIRLHQIGVLVPDALYADYLPHLESAFARLHRLPTNIVSRGAGSESRIGEAVTMLLRLPLGRFTRDELMNVLSHPALRGAAQEWDIERAGRWCDELGIFLGADADDLANTYIPRDNYHWDQGLRRLALGVFMGNEPDQEPRFYAAPDASEYLPLSTSQDDVSAVAAFVTAARSLLFDAIRIRSLRLTLTQWSALLTNLIASQIHTNDPADERARDLCMRALQSIADSEFTSEPVSYRIAHEIVSARLSELQSPRAQFRESGIAVGPISALRSVPFRAIFLLGLNEAQFPERDRRDPMDLRVARVAGDVSPTERDRYLFLETLIAARERICLSYTAREPKTGDRLEPSSVVRELQFILRGYVGVDTLSEMTIEHPLSRYDTDYFRDIQSEVKSNTSIVTRGLVSYDSDARRGALMTALRRDASDYCRNLALPGRDDPIYALLPTPARDALRPLLRMTAPSRPPNGEAGIPAELSLPIAALRKFLECPIQGAAQYALGIYDDDAEDLELSQNEPIAHSILHRTTLMREVFWKARGDTQLAATEYVKALRIAQLMGRAPAGPFAEAAERTDRATMANWIDQAHRAGCAKLDRWHEVRMGRGDEFATADRLVDELLVPLRIPGSDGTVRDRMVRIHGALGFISPGGDASLRLVLRDRPKVKDFLWAFLSALVLTAAEEMSAKHFHAIVAGAGKNKSWHEIRNWTCPSIERAREYLSDLTTDLLFGKNHYFLPIEAVEDVHKEIRRRDDVDLVDIVNETRDNEFAKCSSDYGPIRDARRFAPPTNEALRDLMRRRFELIGGMFVHGKD